jgi:LysM repeat protein
MQVLAMDGRGRNILNPPWKESAVKAARICTGALIWIGLPLFAAVSGGCQHKADGVPNSSSALDLSSSPAYAPAPGYSAAPAQPVYDSTPVVASAITPAYSNSGTSSEVGGGTYVVKKGDTLYGIARKNYGDGKQWQKIASANPGLSPTSLKVGQAITLP